jgi:ABC-type sulfate transport system substrate-binding protein
MRFVHKLIAVTAIAATTAGAVAAAPAQLLNVSYDPTREL